MAKAKKERTPEEQKKINDRKALIDLISYELLNYESGQPFSTVVLRKIKEYEFYGYDVVYDCIKNNLQLLKRYANDTTKFSTEYGKISYLFAIINAKLPDEFEKAKKIKNDLNKQNQKTIYNVNPYEIGTKQKANDISEWLEDDDI